MKKRTKKPYCVRYRVKDRFGHQVHAKATFDSWEKAKKYAFEVAKVENSSKGSSAKLLSWGTNHQKGETK